jgi:metallo-beta-lactamase family protein
MDINLTFMGAARGVTGSRNLIEANGMTLLVDCGLYQDHEFLHRNWEPFRCKPSS